MVKSGICVVAAIAAVAAGTTVPSGGQTALTFGFNTPLVYGPFGAIDVARAASNVTNGALVRFTVEWPQVQAACADQSGQPAVNDATCVQPGAFNWTSLDGPLDAIAGALQAGRVRLLLVPVNAPSWAYGPNDTQNNGCWFDHVIRPPGDDAAGLSLWRRYVAALVAHVEGRYGRAGLYGIEVWNEEDSCWTWRTVDTVPRGDRYASLLASAALGVRSVDRTVPLLFGGSENPAFLDQSYAAINHGRPDIRRYMSSIGVHPYSSNPPDMVGGLFIWVMNHYRYVAAAHGDSRPLSITEYGVSIANPPTAQDQADWLLKAYQMASTGSWNVNLFLVHSLFNVGEPYGVCAGPGLPGPAATALKQLLSGGTPTC